MSRARVVYEGPPLSHEDIADQAGRLADAYGGGSAADDAAGVAIVDGFGARVIVERGHLELHDGVGEHRRVRRFAKVDAPRRLVVGIGTVGVVSFDALRWCARVGVPVVVLGGDGAVLAGGPPGRDDARLLRAQALALYGPTGLEITRYLIAAKLRGQARILGLRLSEDEAAATLAELVEVVEAAASIDEVRQCEATAANVYFASWERRVEVTFARKDSTRIPAHWSRFNGRRSAVNRGSPRSATDPAGAMLNYAYRLAEIEAAACARRLGLSETIGVLHADMAGRPSFACDVMEPIRPIVDAHVLDLCAGPLRKREFTEDARGVVRVLAPLTHTMAQGMPAYAYALGPVVEHVADILAGSSPYDVTVPSVLTGAKHKAAARKRVADEREAKKLSPPPRRGPGVAGLAPRGRPRRRPITTPPMPESTCQGCGIKLPVESDRSRARRDWCEGCLPERREEVGSLIHEASLAHAAAFAEASGTRPTHTAEATAARSAANVRQRAEQAAFFTMFDTEPAAAWYRQEVAPKLALLTLPAIAKATGVSTSAASKWRACRTTPHARHWKALAELVGVEAPGPVSHPPLSVRKRS